MTRPRPALDKSFAVTRSLCTLLLPHRLKTAQARFELLTRFGAWLVPEYRFKWPWMDWWHDASFKRYLEKFGEDRVHNADRRWMLGQLLRLVTDVPGDTVECGVYKGSSSWLICRANAGMSGRHHHIFDSFQGISEPDPSDGDHWTRGDLSCSEETVRKALEEFRDFTLYPGWIPDRFHEIANRSFSFVHIDVDLLQPTKDSLEFFFPRLSPGGILLCDDYGVTTCPGATKALNDYFQGRSEKPISLSGGGGYVIKGKVTGHLAALT
ncbi:MAG: TylF/MycF/NovP-related O-methyltransferase [Planctomycetota bacterium]